MSPFAPFTEDQFRLMAMCKARAYTWDHIAEEVHMPIEIVERVAWTHEKQWNRFLTKAERHIARETISEVAGVLRKDIRNAEPQYHATLTNSLTRLLQLQQDFAPPRRPRPSSHTPPTPTTPEVVPAPVVSTPTPAPAVGTSLGATVASLLGFFVLLAALLMGCWNRARGHEQTAFITHEPTACMVAVSEAPFLVGLCGSSFSVTGPPATASSWLSSG